MRVTPERCDSDSSLAWLRPTSTGSGRITASGAMCSPPCLMMAAMERSRCWFPPMRPVTPFMIMPTRCVLMALISDSCYQFVTCRGLRLRSGRERWRFDARPRQGAFQFLAPVGHVARRAVTVYHFERSIAQIGHLVKESGGDINRLTALHNQALAAQAHFPAALDDEINLFLGLIMPGHLAALGGQRHIADGEVPRLQGRRA